MLLLRLLLLLLRLLPQHALIETLSSTAR